MNKSEMNRRAFLEKFVALSSASLVFVGCNPTASSVYGPGALPEITENSPTVVGIYFQNSDGELELLYQKTNLPLNLSIEILFSKDMNEYSEQNIFLRDSDYNNIAFDTRWVTKQRLEIIPLDNEIKYDTEYTIEIDSYIQSEDGNYIDRTQGNLEAIFKTKPKEEDS